MVEVIGVSFANSNKIYYFLPNGLELHKKDNVVVETENGEQFGIVVTGLISIDPDKLSSTLRNVLRIANRDDERINNKNVSDSVNALNDAIKFANDLGLDMKIMDASFTFDRKQLLINFVSDERVDFRELAKKLASVYRTRIELRQIGVRDKAREVGGIGQCGRSLCCSTFLKEMSSVSINMAKNQNLALNPQKINGACGRLMCCLGYENDCYQEYKKGLPKIGQMVSEDGLNGKVVFVDMFNRSYKVELEDKRIVDVDLSE